MSQKSEALQTEEDVLDWIASWFTSCFLGFLVRYFQRINLLDSDFTYPAILTALLRARSFDVPQLIYSFTPLQRVCKILVEWNSSFHSICF